jgi:hypothetical protein
MIGTRVPEEPGLRTSPNFYQTHGGIQCKLGGLLLKLFSCSLRRLQTHGTYSRVNMLLQIAATLSAMAAGSVLMWAPCSETYTLQTATSDLVNITHSQTKWIEALVTCASAVLTVKTRSIELSSSRPRFRRGNATWCKKYGGMTVSLLRSPRI